MKYQHSHGHPDLMVTPCGFHISATHLFLGASPDGAIYDPQQNDHSFGFLEVKCPYTQAETFSTSRDLLPEEDCSVSGFYCACNPVTSTLKLKTNHAYFAQVQGQMAVGGSIWCVFVIFTRKGIHIQHIKFDNVYWTERLLPKLEVFYDNCFAPKLVSPVHALLGLYQRLSRHRVGK